MRMVYFLLPMLVRDSATTSEILEDAEKKLNEIRVTKWVPIAKELAMEDPYMFLRAYSPGRSPEKKCMVHESWTPFH